MEKPGKEKFDVVRVEAFSPAPRIDPGQIAIWRVSDTAMQTAIRKALAWYGPNGERWHHGEKAVDFEGGAVKSACIWYAADQHGVPNAVLQAYREIHPTDGTIGDFNANPRTTFSNVRAIYARAIELASAPQ